MDMIKHDQLQVGIRPPAQGKNPYSLLTTRDRCATLPIAYLVSIWIVETEAPWNESVGLAGYRQDREVIIPKLASFLIRDFFKCLIRYSSNAS